MKRDKRLTKEDILHFPQVVGGRVIGKRLSCLVVAELLEYKNIEEDLGIDIPTLHALVKSRKIFSYGHTSIMENSISGINIYDKTITIWDGYCHSNYSLSEYGKSFALTREELK